VGIAGAGHAELGHQAETCVITPVACPVPDSGAPKLSGARRVRIRRDSRLFAIYCQEQADEEYFCNYEVNSRYIPSLEAAGLRFVAFGDQGEPRALELPDRRFFIATLFLPQDRAAQPHPFIAAYLKAAL